MAKLKAKQMIANHILITSSSTAVLERHKTINNIRYGAKESISQDPIIEELIDSRIILLEFGSILRNKNKDDNYFTHTRIHIHLSVESAAIPNIVFLEQLGTILSQFILLLLYNFTRFD